MAAVWKQLWSMVCTPYPDGNYLPTFFHGLLANGFWTFPVGQRKGTLHMPSSLAQTDRDAHQGEFPTFSGNHWSFANTKLTTTLEGERRGGSHSIWHVVPSIVPFEILLVGEETIGRLGWYFSFMQMCQCRKTLLLIKFEIPKGKAYVSPLYCAWCSARYG